MTKQEKWLTTIQCMQLVRKNYRTLRSGGSYRMTGVKRRQMRTLIRWLTAIDRTYDRLRSRKNKSGARARQDWLVARTIEMMVYDDADADRIRRHLTGPRPLTPGYVGRLTETAVLEVLASAEEEGLFG